MLLAGFEKEYDEFAEKKKFNNLKSLVKCNQRTFLLLFQVKYLLYEIFFLQSCFVPTNSLKKRTQPTKSAKSCRNRVIFISWLLLLFFFQTLVNKFKSLECFNVKNVYFVAIVVVAVFILIELKNPNKVF